MCKSCLPHKNGPSWPARRGLTHQALPDQGQPQIPGHTGLGQCEREDPKGQVSALLGSGGRSLGSHSRGVPTDTCLGWGSQAGPEEEGHCVGGSMSGRTVTPGSESCCRREILAGVMFDNKLALGWRGMPVMVRWKRWVECRKAISGRAWGRAKSRRLNAHVELGQVKAATRVYPRRENWVWVRRDGEIDRGGLRETRLSLER